MKKEFIFWFKVLLTIMLVVLPFCFLVSLQNANAETEKVVEETTETVTEPEGSIEDASGESKLTESDNNSEKMTPEEVYLSTALKGDMVIAYSNDLTVSCTLIVKLQEPEGYPRKMKGTFPDGECVNNDRNTIWYENIISIADGKVENLTIIPKEDISAARRVKFGILTLFKKN